MKTKTSLLILGAVLLIAVAVNAMPVVIKHGVFTREIPCQPQVYTPPHIQMPNWWPH